MSGRGKYIMIEYISWYEWEKERRNGRKREENGHISQYTLPLWTYYIEADLPAPHLLDPRALLGGSASTRLSPLLHLLFPRNLMVYLEISSK